MLYLKRINDLKEYLSSDYSDAWIEINRKVNGNTYQPYRISVVNFLSCMFSKLSEMSLAKETEFDYTQYPLGSLMYMTYPTDNENYLPADGNFYTDYENNSMYNVINKPEMERFIDFLQDMYRGGCNSIVSIDIHDTDDTQSKSKNVANRGKYLCDFDSRVIRMPTLNSTYLRFATDTRTGGRYSYPSAPNVTGMFAACYHLFNKSTDTSKKLLNDLKKVTSGMFSLNVGQIDKNYVETDLNLSNQNEKYDWLSLLGQLLKIDCSEKNGVFTDDNTINADSIKLIPYICINNVFGTRQEG